MPKLVFMPPQDDLKLWFAKRLADTLSEYEVASPETDEEAIEAIATADAAMGWVPPAALEVARRLRWLHNPDAGPFFGYYYPELLEHRVTIVGLMGTSSGAPRPECSLAQEQIEGKVGSLIPTGY